MIGINELAEIKELRKTNLYYEEKEYLQYIFLNAISKYVDKNIFKGGTCLRICYGLERASEDLDFSTILKPSEIKEMVKSCLKNFDLLNIKHNVYAEKEFKGNLRFEIRFEGPLFSGKPSSTNTLKIDFNRQKSKYTLVKVIPKIFSDVPLFTLVTLDEKEIFAEKIRSLANRKQSRDLYDLWMLLGKKVEIDKGLIADKLKEEKGYLHKIILPSKEEYELNLKNIVMTLPPYDQVRTDVEKFLDNLKKIVS